MDGFAVVRAQSDLAQMWSRLSRSDRWFYALHIGLSACIVPALPVRLGGTAATFQKTLRLITVGRYISVP
ncbi:hypothetical protein CKJ61_07730 [Mycobacterium intracellulare]|nr:hypothetical protein CKJ61_07730 [Mycobacterium intracellulare]